MTKNTKDDNKIQSNSSVIGNDIFTFNVTEENYDLFVDFDNITISSNEVKLSCNKNKVEIQNAFNKLTISKTNKLFKVLIKDPKIKFKDNQSAFKIKVKDNFLMVSITTPFKISVKKDVMLFSSDSDDVLELNKYADAKSKKTSSNVKDNKKLLISEAKNKTYLPYTADELEAKLETKKYNSIEELIESEYTISNDYYKFPILARFREGYRLMREKEHSSTKKAIDLGIELMFNFNLNPSIITACKNLEQLNIYLDCLEENELNKFFCFDIIYEVTPAKI